jgi:chemotaxis signal transduction protein
MDKSEYLIARVGKIKLGVYCRDVQNVYIDKIRLFRSFNQGGYFLGLTVLNGQVMQVLDLRRRISMEDRDKTDKMTLVSFNTGGKNSLAVVVDEIIGMKCIENDCIRKNDQSLGNRKNNIDLLFPMIAVMNQGFQTDISNDDGLIHLLDATYLEKHEPIIDDSGELELF